MKRRHLLRLASSMVVIGLAGCSWFNGLTMRSQSPDPEPEVHHTRLLGEMVVPTGVDPVRIESVGLVTGLHGTGSDPSPSPQRAELIEEMQTRGVAAPNQVLASGDVSLVLVQGFLWAGIQEGDRFDVEVRVPSHCDTSSLRGGYLLDARLSEMAVLGNQVHSGTLLARAQGPVMVDPMADPKEDRIAACRGRILGGGIALKSRPLGLVLMPEHKSVLNSSKVANAINRRFNTFQKGVKSGMAKAKTDELIDLAVHPRYRDNIDRYIKVVLALPLTESEPERMQRLATLRQELLEPATSAEAAIQLEALGVEGADVLLKAIASTDPEVRFYAAESLAYLDRREAAEPLGLIARNQPAFRVYALAALSTMQEYAAYEQLRDLLAMPSAETRYGAFRALWAMNKNDSFIKGESIGGQFTYHVLDVSGPSMIHVTRSRIPEIVVFGPQQQFTTPLAINAGNDIMVTSAGGDQISVSRYSVKDGDQKRLVSTRVDDVIRAIVELGGTYPDVVQGLQEAKNAGALASRFEVDALPGARRSYERIADGEAAEESDAAPQEEQESEKSHKRTARAVPDLFAQRGVVDKPVASESADDDEPAETPKKKGILARMFSR